MKLLLILSFRDDNTINYFWSATIWMQKQTTHIFWQFLKQVGSLVVQWLAPVTSSGRNGCPVFRSYLEHAAFSLHVACLQGLVSGLV